jgi:ATP-binding cassette subfamily B multidrug efflux pump
MYQAILRSLRFMRAYRLTAVAAVAAVLLASGAELVSPQLLRLIIDQGITGRQPDVILWGSLGLVAVAVAGGIATFYQGYLSARASYGAAYDMRNEIFGKLQTLSFGYHDRAETGQLITRVTSDVDLVREFVGGGLVQAVSAVILLAGAVVLLLAMNWVLALVAFATIPLTLAVLLVFVRGLGPTYRQFQARLAGLNSVLQENIAGIRVVKAFAREDFERGRYDAANGDLLETGMVVRRTVANAFPLLFFVGTLGVAVVTGAGAVMIVLGTLSTGELVAFTAYLALLLQPLFIIGFGAQSIARSGASATRLWEILDAPDDVADRPGATVLGQVTGAVEFRDVSLRYPGDDHETLCEVSFTVAPDTTVAVVGATGSGKTSIVNLIPRFYDVSEGAVLVDGHDVRDVTLDSLRSAVGVVMQDSVLFSGTVRENIAYGRPHATEAQVVEAARAAQADAFVRELPEGYDTLVGERGIKLSGGQRQRIAIARALLVDPRILIMDDSTSSVDARTEAALRARLDTLMAGRTTFVVAQRLSTVKKADIILLVDDGRLVATGTHEELLADECLYAEIAASQLVRVDGGT